MKNYFRLLPILPILLLTACTSSYTIKDFKSKAEFYNSFNNMFSDKPGKAELLNDSVVIFNNGAIIRNDTLYSVIKSIEYENKKISASEIKEMNYLAGYNKAVLALKNGQTIKVKNLSAGGDSVAFSEEKTLLSANYVAPIDKVNCVLYKNIWTGIYPGAVTGLCLGVIAGTVKSVSYGSKDDRNEPATDIFNYSGIGIIIGSVAGNLIGWKYVFQFNPPN